MLIQTLKVLPIAFSINDKYVHLFDGCCYLWNLCLLLFGSSCVVELNGVYHQNVSPIFVVLLVTTLPSLVPGRWLPWQGSGLLDRRSGPRCQGIVCDIPQYCQEEAVDEHPNRDE